MPPVSRPRHRAGRVLTSGGGAKATFGGIIGVIVICAFLGLKVCRVAKRVVGETIENKVVTIAAGDDYGGILEVDGSYTYTFEVTALDGPVRIGVTLIKSKTSPSEAEVTALVAGSKEVGQGRTETITGPMRTGNYMWVVLNPDENKPVQAKVSFVAR